MTKLISFGLLAVGAITIGVISITPRTHGTSKRVAKMETLGLPEHGLSLVGPGNSTFEQLIAAQRQQSSKGRPIPPESFSVFVVNNGDQSVAAFNVKFEVVSPDGETVTNSMAHSATLTTVSNIGSLMEDISPRGNRLLSLGLPDSGVHIKMGGDLQSDIAQQLSRSAKINAFLDGVLFVDGTFVGPDTMNYFPRLRAEIEAVQDLKRDIRQMVVEKEAPDVILNRIEAENAVRLGGAQPPAGKDPDYVLMRKRYASTVLSMMKSGGVRAVSEFLAAEATKAQIGLRKL